MPPRVREVCHVKDYRLRVRFSDGTVAELDFRPRIVGRGGVFLPLQDVEFFKRVRRRPRKGERWSGRTAWISAPTCYSPRRREGPSRTWTPSWNWCDIRGVEW